MKTINEFLQEFKEYYNKVGYEGRKAIIEGVMKEIIKDRIKIQDYTPVYNLLAKTKEQLKLMQAISGKIKLAVIAEYNLDKKYQNLLNIVKNTLKEKTEQDRPNIKKQIRLGELETESDLFSFTEQKLKEIHGIENLKIIKSELYDIIYKESLAVWKKEKSILSNTEPGRD